MYDVPPLLPRHPASPLCQQASSQEHPAGHGSDALAGLLLHQAARAEDQEPGQVPESHPVRLLECRPAWRHGRRQEAPGGELPPLPAGRVLRLRQRICDSGKFICIYVIYYIIYMLYIIYIFRRQSLLVVIWSVVNSEDHIKISKAFTYYNLI